MITSGFKTRQLKEVSSPVLVKAVKNAGSSQCSTRIFTDKHLATPTSAGNNRQPPPGSTCIVGCRSNMRRLENFLLADGGSYGETESGLFLFPIVQGRMPSRDVARALATDRGLTRMPGGPGATVEAIVRSGVGDKKIPLVSGGTTAEPHGRDRWLGGATGARHFNVNVAPRRPPQNRKIRKYLETFMDIWSAEEDRSALSSPGKKNLPVERGWLGGYPRSGEKSFRSLGRESLFSSFGRTRS